MRKIRLDDSCLNHLTNIPVGCTRKSSCIHTFWEITFQNIMYFGVRECVRTWRNLYATPLVGSEKCQTSHILVRLVGLRQIFCIFGPSERHSIRRLASLGLGYWPCVCATDWRKSTLMSISPIIILWVTHINNRGNKMYICYNLLSSVDVAKPWFRAVTGGLMLTL